MFLYGRAFQNIKEHWLYINTNYPIRIARTTFSFQSAKFLTENTNLDIFVDDSDAGKVVVHLCFSDSNAYRVIVVYLDGQLMFKYTGHAISDFFYPETLATYSQEKKY